MDPQPGPRRHDRLWPGFIKSEEFLAQPDRMPAALAKRHAAHGVDIRLRTSLVGLEGTDTVRRALLSDGTQLEVGAVVAGIGIAPNVELAQQCGALVRTGVVVDAQGRTSVPYVYAAGDVTEQHCAWHDAAVRIETWDNANRQGEAAAAHIVGAEAEKAAPPPWFWSDQYGANLQVVGAPLQGDCVLASEGAGQKLAIHLRGDRVIGAVGINRPRDMRRLRKVLGEGGALTQPALEELGFIS